MRIGRYFIPVLLFMSFLILFGDKGLVDYFSLRGKLIVLREASKQIESENKVLKEKIVLLRHDLRYIENVARKELGMVKKGDMVYRFVE